MKRVLAEIGDDLKRAFALKCFNLDVTQKKVLIDLISKWIKEKK